MAETELVIVDEYLEALKNYFDEKGMLLDQMVWSYVALLSEVTTEAIIGGETRAALDTFRAYATQLMDKIPDMVSAPAKAQIDSFISQIDQKDQYLF